MDPLQPVVSFVGVSKLFGDVVAASSLDLQVQPGEFLSFLGPSGCGKTTMLRMIAGFEQPTKGDVFLQGTRVNGIPAYRRPVNMVFQHYALFPHLNVFRNIAYGLKQSTPTPPADVIGERVGRALELVRLDGYQGRRIWELSGGQQQRVALARALVNEPRVLLLDEPLAALDRKLRREMQIELQNLQRRIGITFILVTHDQEEALSMSDRVCIMREGEIVQVGSPRELYDNPRNRYVADFVGKSNFFDGIAGPVENTGQTIKLNNGMQLVVDVPKSRQPPPEGQPITLSVRPEQIILTRSPRHSPDDAAILIEARVRNRIFLGEHTEYLLSEESLGEFLALAPRQIEASEAPFEVNEKVHVCWSRAAALLLDNLT